MISVILYVVTVVLFSVGAWIAPLPFLPIVWLYRYISGVPVVPPTHPVYLIPYLAGSIILVVLTDYVWRQIGYEVGWLLIVIIAVIHLLFGSAQGANRANQAQAFGTMVGVIVAGFIV